MAETITVKFKVLEDGSLQAIGKHAKKAREGLDQATKAGQRYNKQQKGVGGLTSNSTKAFSKMTSGITGGLVPAYATLAANVFALTALFGALSRAASLRLLEEGLLRVGNAAGTNLSVVSQKLKEITGNAISTESAMRSVALATSAGFSTKQLQDLTKVAKGASVALGRDMSDAMDRLVRGTAKLEPEILDELGIMVRLDDAVASYAIGLNKSAQDLTQYERRMAFLTATNEQGLQKFGALAEAIDVNPYDKLAASFSNLANKVINVLNVAIEPLVNILSANPVALMAAVTMFAGTLVSQIVPAITASANAARKMATATSKEASRLAAKTTHAFQSSAKAVSSFKFAPKSLDALNTQLRTGSVNAATLKDGIKRLQATELRRQKNLDAGALKNKAQKETEIAQIRQLKAELIALQKQEKAGSSAGGSLGRAKGMSSTSRKTAAAFKMMDGAGPLDGFKIAAASVGKQAKDVGKATGALNKLSIGFRVAGNGAKLFGTAMLNAIPVIGQLIMVASILYPLLSKLFEKDELKTAAIKATKAFESFDSIGDQLGDTLARTSSEAERFIATMRVQIGVVEQVSSAFSALKAAQENMSNQELVDSMQKILDLKKSIGGPLWAQAIARGLSDKEQENFDGLKERLVEAEVAHAKLKQATGLARVAESILVLDKAIESSKGNTVLNDSLGETIEGLEALKTKFEAAQVSGEGMSYETLIRETDALLGKNKQVVSSVDAAKQVYNDFRKEITDLGDKGSHALDGVIKAQKNLTKEMVAAGAEGGMGTEAFLSQAKGLEGLLNRFKKGAEESEDVMKRLTAHVDAQKDIMLTQVQTQKRLKVEMGKVKQFAAGNEEATKILIGLEEDVRTSKEASLRAEEEAFTVLEMQTSKKDRLAEITRELAVIDAARADTAVDTLRSSIEGIKHSQKLLALTNQQAAAERQMSLDTMKRAENQARMAKMKTGRDFTPLDELKQFKATELKRKQLIFEEMASKLHALDLERQLLVAQTKLQKARATIVEKELKLEPGSLSKPFDDILTLFPAVFQARMSAVVSSALTKVSDLDLGKATKQSSVSKAAITASGTGDTTSERIRNTIDAGNPAEGLDKTGAAVATMTAQISQLDPMIEKLKTLGPEGEVVAALTGGALAIQAAFLTMAHSISAGMTEGLSAGEISATETVGKLQIAGAALSMLSQTLAASSSAKIAGIDREIAAEQKRDGKSAASVAKLKVLDKKKEAAAKKAFNINKAMQLAQVAISTATAVMQLYTNPMDPFKIAAAAMTPWIVGLGAAQMAMIASTSFQGGGSVGGGASPPPKTISVGKRGSSVDLSKSKSASGELGYLRGDSGNGGANNFKPTSAFSGYTGRAAGGYIVGEQGPEIFMPETPGNIIPSGQDTGGTTNVNFSISAIDASGVEELLIDQRGNLIGMMREAANSYGQDFMEGVDTAVYTPSTAGATRY